MKIEIWSDFACPFCYIGKRQLDLALKDFPNRKHVMIEYRSYELNSSVDKNSNKKMKDFLADYYNIPIKKIQEMTADITEQAKQVGLTYRLDNLMQINTFDVHRFMKYACTKNKESEVVERLLQGYFINMERIDDHSILMKISEEFQFNEDEVSSVLNAKKFSRAVKCDQTEAKEMGIQGVPFFLFNEQYAVSGAQPIDVFKQVLETIWEKMNEEPKFTLRKSDHSKTSYCTGSDCEKE